MENKFDVQDMLEQVENSCSNELSKEEYEIVLSWFKVAFYKAKLLELVLSGQIEIIGTSEGGQ